MLISSQNVDRRPLFYFGPILDPPRNLLPCCPLSLSTEITKIDTGNKLSSPFRYLCHFHVSYFSMTFPTGNPSNSIYCCRTKALHLFLGCRQFMKVSFLRSAAWPDKLLPQHWHDFLSLSPYWSPLPRLGMQTLETDCQWLEEIAALFLGLILWSAWCYKEMDCIDGVRL